MEILSWFLINPDMDVGGERGSVYSSTWGVGDSL